MKKITLTTLVLLLTCLLTAQAGPIDQQKARQLAAQFMQKKGLQLKGEPRRAPGVSGTGSNEAQPLYIFNTDGAKGFVIVAGDDRADAILGYSTEGSYDEQNLPDNFRYYLQLLSSNMQALMASDATATTRRAVETHDAIAPLIKTKWDQGSATAAGYIYNTACPIHTLKHCLTGCVATAGAQIMYYYRYPESTTGVDGYQVDGQYLDINADTKKGLPETTFNWDIMKLSYNDADQGTESQQEVAKLMVYAGFAAQMNYGLGGSGADSRVLADGMVKYFDYNPNTWQYVSRSDYSVRDWDNMMYNELANRRPIIYSGQSKVGGGHAFICDGYDGEGLYHFNWGWGGQNNGYFKLAATNPYAGDGTQRDGFVNDIDAVIGLQPNNGETITKSPMVSIYNFNISEKKITMSYQNISDEECAFDCGIALLDDDGSVNQLQLDYYPHSGTVLPPNYYRPGIQFNLAAYLKQKGTYKVVPVFRLAGETEWKRCMPSQLYFEVVVAEDKTMTIITHPTVELEATQIEVTGNKIETLVQQVDVTVESKSDDYQGPLYLFASKTEDKGAYTYLAGTAIEGGASDVVTFYFTPATAGTWNLWIATDEAGNDNDIIGQTTAEIGEAPTKSVSFQVTNKDVIMGEDNATIVFSVQNTSETTSYREFYVWLNKADDNTPVEQKPTSAITIEQGETKDVPITFDGLEDGVTYNVVYGYYSNVKGTTLWWLDDYEFTFEASTTAITLPEADTTADDTFYTLNGQRMSGRPNKAGIYIHKGKKVIVR